MILSIKWCSQGDRCHRKLCTDCNPVQPKKQQDVFLTILEMRLINSPIYKNGTVFVKESLKFKAFVSWLKQDQFFIQNKRFEDELADYKDFKERSCVIELTKLVVIGMINGKYKYAVMSLVVYENWMKLKRKGK
jgi:hypothetical protein